MLQSSLDFSTSEYEILTPKISALGFRPYTFRQRTISPYNLILHLGKSNTPLPTALLLKIIGLGEGLYSVLQSANG
jgi:hypothetical protein